MTKSEGKLKLARVATLKALERDGFCQQVLLLPNVLNAVDGNGWDFGVVVEHVCIVTTAFCRQSSGSTNRPKKKSAQL